MDAPAGEVKYYLVILKHVKVSLLIWIILHRNARGQVFPPADRRTSFAVMQSSLIDDETILLSDQFFNKTLDNIKKNPKVSVTFWEGHEGYQLKGIIVIETSGKRYEETARWIEELGTAAGFPLRSKGIVILKIEEIYGVTPGTGAGKLLA